MNRSFQHRFIHLSAMIAVTAAALTSAHAASVCPFDSGGSDALNDGVVLTRYALGITGAPLCDGRLGFPLVAEHDQWQSG